MRMWFKVRIYSSHHLNTLFEVFADNGTEAIEMAKEKMLERYKDHEPAIKITSCKCWPSY